MIRNPRPNASNAISQNSGWLAVTTNTTTSTSSSMPRPRFNWCCRANRIGAPFMVPCSLAKAISEPEKVMAPITRPSDISINDWVWIAPGTPIPNEAGAFSAEAATNTAARPTSEWKAATNCGKAVIWMRRATTTPTAPPIRIATAISRKPEPAMPRCNNVATTAMAMPAMPNWLPVRAVTGLDSPRRASTNRTAATR